MRKSVYCLALIMAFGATTRAADVAFTANLQGYGSAPAAAYVNLVLTNCAAGAIPTTIADVKAVSQQILRANSSGVVTAAVTPTADIACGAALGETRYRIEIRSAALGRTPNPATDELIAAAEYVIGGSGITPFVLDNTVAPAGLDPAPSPAIDDVNFTASLQGYTSSAASAYLVLALTNCTVNGLNIPVTAEGAKAVRQEILRPRSDGSIAAKITPNAAITCGAILGASHYRVEIHKLPPGRTPDPATDELIGRAEYVIGGVDGAVAFVLDSTSAPVSPAPAPASSIDFETYAATRPFRRVAFASFPATCIAGKDWIERSDPAVAGQALYRCNAAGTGWDLVGDGGGGSSPNFAASETPTGTVDGSNATFTLAQTPVTNSLELFKNGQLMIGGGADYTLTTNSITYVTGAKPKTGDVHLAYYRY